MNENDDKIKGPGSVNHHQPEGDNGSDVKWRGRRGTNLSVATLKFADWRSRRIGRRGSRPLYQRQPLDRLEFPLDVPENASLGLPVTKRVPKRDELPREEMSHTFVGDQVTKRPWYLVSSPSASHRKCNELRNF